MIAVKQSSPGDTRYFLGFSSLFPFLTYKRFVRLLSFYGNNLAVAWRDRGNWGQRKLHFRNEETRASFQEAVDRVNLEHYSTLVERSGFSWMPLVSKRYPQALRNVDNPPLVLYFKGNLNLLYQKNIAFVGSRRASFYGRQVVKEFIPCFSRVGLGIVSGLAIGIDALAHREALRSGGSTIAVMPAGLDYVVPHSNQGLFQRIANSPRGLVISEFPFGIPPQRYYFPLRSRVVVGLSQAVVVGEAGEKSGTSYTVTAGIKQKKPVFAVPSPITNHRGGGANVLIASGRARLATSASAVLQSLGLIDKVASLPDISRRLATLSAGEASVYKLLSVSSMDFDELLATTGFNPVNLNTILTGLEIKGMVTANNGVFSAE